jgi:subtilase family serine protease
MGSYLNRLSAALLLLISVMALASLATAVSFSQSPSAPQPLITRPVDEAALVSLRGNTHPFIQRAYDRGAAPQSMAANRLLLILKRSQQQENALQVYLQSVQDRNSPNFRAFLSPVEFGQRYGIADTDLQTVEAWLRGHGLTVARVSKGRTAIEFSGTAGQVQAAFHTSIHKYASSASGGTEHWANATDPQIPAALAPVIAGVASLNDFKPRPQAVKGPSGKWSASAHRFLPDLTIDINGSNYLFAGPGDAATIYNSPNQFNAHLPSGQAAYDGTGVTIGVVEDTYADFSDTLNYQSLFGLPSNQESLVVDGNPFNFNADADDTEAVLDLEIAQALAPAANIIMYTAEDTTFQPGIFLAAYRAIDDNAVSILSLSFSGCEVDQGASGNLEILNAWEQAAAQGISVVVSTDDSGSAGCDDPDTETVATGGLAVNGLASTPYNIAVGGTDFDVLSSSFATYVGTTSGAHQTTALSYIPEDAWNNSTPNPGLLSANTPNVDATGHTNVVAGGGGVSSAGDWTTGTPAGYAKPAWQQGFAPSATDGVRDLPDVSLLASNGTHHAIWAVCGDSDCQGTDPTISGIGGTSASAPAFAGILALVSQSLGASVRLGQADWVLYKLAATAPHAFHPTQTSNNSVYCSTGTPDCGPNNFLNGYNTAGAYSPATGLGSVDIIQLISHWDSTGPAATATSLTLNKTSFVHGTPVSVNVTVSPSAAAGNVAVTSNAGAQPGATSSPAAITLPLQAGSAATSYSQLPGGAYNVFANYGGNGSYAGSMSQGVPVTVTPEDSQVQFTADTILSNNRLSSLAGATVPLGTSTILDAAPIGKSQASSSQPITDATGTIFFGDTYSSLFGQCSTNVTLTSAGTAEAAFATCGAGAHSITAQYYGDLSYNQSVSAPINFTVLQAPTSISLTSDITTIAYGQVNITAKLADNVTAAGFYPINPISFTNTTNNTSLGTASALANTCPSGIGVCVTSLLQLTPQQLLLGANAITATYPGDTNFAASAPSAPITITCTAGCSNGTGQTLFLDFGGSTGIVAPGGSLAFTVNVAENGGFAGAVNLTCSIKGKNAGDINLPTCSFNPTQVTLTSQGTVSSTLTIKTTAPITSTLAYPATNRWLATTAAMACLLIFGLGGDRRRCLLSAFVLLAALSGISACGGSSSGGTGTTGGGGGTHTIPGTTPDTYTVTFNAADAATGTLTAEDYFTIDVD